MMLKKNQNTEAHQAKANEYDLRIWIGKAEQDI